MCAMECVKDSCGLSPCAGASPVKLEKPNYMLMSLQRLGIIAIIIISVIFVVYVTPMPEEYFLDCDRECHELDWPMICRVKLTVEVYKTLSRSCDNCPEAGGSCSAAGCISADGRERGVLSANRALPAKPIHVCHNDILVVDLVNRAPAHALSLHWRGQPQRETPFMDGVPMITQCPAPSYTTFQYKFRASVVGTHMYHAHSGAEAADGLAGVLVVRQSPRLDPTKSLYDEDLSQHVLLIAEWGKSLGALTALNLRTPKAESILINGKGRTPQAPEAPLSVFRVNSDKRYRFRVAYAGGAKSCPITLSIEGHSVTLIALDGHQIIPKEVSSIELSKGERADFVLLTNQIPTSYKVKVTAAEQCQEDLEGSAELVYSGIEKETVTRAVDLNVVPEFSSLKSKRCETEGAVCLEEVEAVEALPEELTAETLDVELYMPFNYTMRQKSAKRLESWGITDGHRFTYPASPLLTQPADVPEESFCQTPETSEQPGSGTECVHVKNIPLGATVEVIMFDQGGESDHVFHLHGYSFYVVGIREFNSSVTKETVAQMNRDNTLFVNKNLRNPVQKDTITIPRLGAVALRFKADNPGYWMMRDERSDHWTRGLDFLLKVGEDRDFVKAPSDFPRCGSYVGPEYFLI